MIPPALLSAAHDPLLKGAPLAVYCHTLGVLDFHEFRPVKVISVASAVRIEPWNAGWALRRLCDSGYLQRGKPENRVRTYRLVWSVKEKSA